VLATLPDSGDSNVIVAAQQANMLATSFHPELTQDTRMHRLFLERVEKLPATRPA